MLFTGKVGWGSHLRTTLQPAVPVKTVTILLDPAIEPWGIGIAKWLVNPNSKGQLNFDFGITTATKILRENLEGLMPKAHPHLVRHFLGRALDSELGLFAA
jgi:hypothetical protein